MKSLSCFAQDTFFKAFDDSLSDKAAYSIAEAENGHYFISATSHRPNNQAYVDDIALYELNGEGQLLKTNYFGGKGGEYNPQIIKANDGGYLVYASSTSYSDIIDTFWIKIETDTFPYFLTFPQVNFYQHLYVLKINANGDSVFQKNYGKQTLGQNVVKMISSGSNSYLLLANENLITGAFVVKTNNNGDTLWTKRIPFPNNYYTEFGDVMLSNDSLSFFVSGMTAESINSPFHPVIISISMNGKTNWIWEGKDAKYSSHSVNQGFLFKENDHYGLSGNVWLNFSDDSTSIALNNQLTHKNLYVKKSGALFFQMSGYNSFALKIYNNALSITDSNYFQWQGKNIVPLECLRTQDGGFAIVGYAYTNNRSASQILFIKTDSLGNVIGYNSSIHPISVQKNNMKIWMNEEMIFIQPSELDNEHYQYRILNIEGELILSGDFQNSSATQQIPAKDLSLAFLLLNIYSSESKQTQTVKLLQYK